MDHNNLQSCRTESNLLASYVNSGVNRIWQNFTQKVTLLCYCVILGFVFDPAHLPMAYITDVFVFQYEELFVEKMAMGNFALINDQLCVINNYVFVCGETTSGYRCNGIYSKNQEI